MSPDSYEGCRRSVFVLAFELASVWKILARCMLPECNVNWLHARRRCQPKIFAGMQVSGFTAFSRNGCGSS